MIRPELSDFRPFYRNWRWCFECQQWFHPDEYDTHKHIYYENTESGERIIMHDSPRRTTDRNSQ